VPAAAFPGGVFVLGVFNPAQPAGH